MPKVNKTDFKQSYQYSGFFNNLPQEIKETRNNKIILYKIKFRLLFLCYFFTALKLKLLIIT